MEAIVPPKWAGAIERISTLRDRFKWLSRSQNSPNDMHQELQNHGTPMVNPLTFLTSESNQKGAHQPSSGRTAHRAFLPRFAKPRLRMSLPMQYGGSILLRTTGWPDGRGNWLKWSKRRAIRCLGVGSNIFRT